MNREGLKRMEASRNERGEREFKRCVLWCRCSRSTGSASSTQSGDGSITSAAMQTAEMS
jgi:hypothetical protein